VWGDGCGAVGKLLTPSTAWHVLLPTNHSTSTVAVIRAFSLLSPPSPVFSYAAFKTPPPTHHTILFFLHARTRAPARQHARRAYAKISARPPRDSEESPVPPAPLTQYHQTHKPSRLIKKCLAARPLMPDAGRSISFAHTAPAADTRPAERPCRHAPSAHVAARHAATDGGEKTEIWR